MESKERVPADGNHSSKSSSKKRTVPILPQQGRLVEEVVEHGVHGEACHALDAGLAGDVLAVGYDGVDADVESIGYLFVGLALGQLDEDGGLALGEFVVVFA